MSNDHLVQIELRVTPAPVGTKLIHKDFGNGMQLWVRPSEVQMDECAFQMMRAGMYDQLQARALSDKMGTLGHNLYAAEPAALYRM